MKNNVGSTAFGAAAFRIIEQYEPEGKRLFRDPVVIHLTSPGVRFMLKFKFMRNFFVGLSNKIIPGIVGAQISRTKFIDEKTLSTLKDVEQIVILGAGLDTRAYRLEGIDEKAVYELDFANVQNIKKKGIRKFLGKLPPSVQYIPIDFNAETIESVLGKASFDFNKPALVILEGVTQYINEDAVDEVFRFISTLPKGSYLLFTYVLRSVIDRKTEESKKIMDWMDKKRSPFIFGIDRSEVGSFLEKYELEMLEDVGEEFYTENYFKPIDRDIPIYSGERCNHSRIKN